MTPFISFRVTILIMVIVQSLFDAFLVSLFVFVSVCFKCYHIHSVSNNVGMNMHEVVIWHNPFCGIVRGGRSNQKGIRTGKLDC